MSQTAAIIYIPDAYQTQGKQLLGRQAAGEGFLKGFVQYGTAERLYCYAASRQAFSEFCQRIHPWAKHPRPVRWLHSDNPYSLAEAGAVYNPDPHIGKFVWHRRFSDPKAYSVCGVTHTIATKEAMRTLGDLLIAPVQPWDALICTSNAVKTAVERLLENWGEYLGQRFGTVPKTQVQLPVIPLGVDCEVFATGEEAASLRAKMRQTLGIAPDDIVVLFVGRLIFYAKAHPVPMYVALENATQATQKKVHLIQAGWFENAKEEADFQESAKVFCPSVNVIFLDGRKPEVRSEIWSVADIFISLADNIQETFGLTPIEAMAAGLPVIVSDWNGYQESVRHEIDGFKIPTLIPQPASALDLVASYSNDSLNYSTYIGLVSMMTAIDLEACTQALIALILDAQLRQQMGENGRTRAKQIYDWQVVIAAYEQLWQELAEIRTSESLAFPMTAGTLPDPLLDDPFRMFQHYSTAVLTPEIMLSLGSMATPEQLTHLRRIWSTNFGSNRRMPNVMIDQVILAISEANSLSVAEILQRFAGDNPQLLNVVSRTLVYLIKLDVLRRNSV
jgi:starch synthase